MYASTSAEKLCLICGDGGAAKHYGGLCCSGCRGFFRRTVRYKRDYVCTRDGNCDTNGRYRNCCRSCRLRKCLASGLDPLLVHSDRACDKAVKIEEPAEVAESKPKSKATAIVKYEPLDDYVTTHHQNVAIISSKRMYKTDAGLPLGVKTIVNTFDKHDFRSAQRYYVLVNRMCDDFYDNEQNHLIAPPDYYKFNLNASLEEAFIVQPRLVSDRTKIQWTPQFFLSGGDFKKVWCRISVYYVDWLSHIPELSLLCDDDKLTLIIGRCVPCVWIIFAYQAYLCKQKACFALTGGSYYPMDEEQYLYNDPILSKFLREMCTWVWTEVVEPARAHNFTEAEFAILKVLCFMAPVPGLTTNGKRVVAEARQYYLAVLSDLVHTSVGEANFEVFSQRLSAILMVLPALEKTSQIEDDNLTIMTMFDIGGLAGSLTYEFYVRRTGRGTPQTSN